MDSHRDTPTPPALPEQGELTHIASLNAGVDHEGWFYQTLGADEDGQPLYDISREEAVHLSDVRDVEGFLEMLTLSDKGLLLDLVLRLISRHVDNHLDNHPTHTGGKSCHVH